MQRQRRLTAMLGSVATAVALAGTITLAAATSSVPAQARASARAAAAPAAPAVARAAAPAVAPANCPVVVSGVGPARRHGVIMTRAAPALPCPGENPPCYGMTCVGKDPHTLGCDRDAQTLATLTAPGGGGTVELRWSAWCAANWARIDVIYWPHYAQTLDGGKEFGSPWTLMVDGTQLARACIPAYSGSSYGPWYCTAWY